jgi:drug/metabolite transporter (DMT)-like permease
MGALSLSITETVLIFAGIPAAVIALVYAAVYSTAARKADKRYRPGRPFTFAPVWFLASPGPLAGSSRPDGAHAITAGEPAKAVTAGPLLATPAEPAVPAGPREVGGASDTW